MRFRSVLFDFDYTLADSSEGAIDCINYSLKKMGLPEAEGGKIRLTNGLSLRKTFEVLTGRADPSEAERFGELFALRADQVMLGNTFLLSEVRPCVERLLDDGMSLAIVTSKFHYRIEAFLKRERLEESFAVIVGAEDVEALKPDPAALKLALERLGVSRRDAVCVGDSAVDAEAAAAAGIDFVAVLSGVTPREAFRRFDCYGVANDLRELCYLLSPDSGPEG